jgi:23S rRNA (adenine2503-C2)-methyltransferase
LQKRESPWKKIKDKTLTDIFEYSLEQWKEFFTGIGEKPFRAKQVVEWIYKKKVSDAGQMKNLPGKIQTLLKENFNFQILTLQTTVESQKDPGTKKMLFATADGFSVESVLIPNARESNTLCISTQIGCPLACDFCATGKMGFKRNLTVSEILYQVYFVLQDYPVSNMVYMGMGEPLLNPNLKESIHRLTAPDYFDFASRSITVSTVGIPEGIRVMADIKQIKLAWSYHSSLEENRKKLFPKLSEMHSLDEILHAFSDYQEKTKKRITLEYLLIKNFNDNEREAEALKQVSRRLMVHLNIIPYNPHPLSSYEAPGQKDIQDFFTLLKGIQGEVTLRRSKGRDIQGACGQLAGSLGDTFL